MMSLRVKICGITNMDDALVAVDAGADALGFIFYPESPRCVQPETAARIIEALPPFVQTVGLFVNADPARINDICTTCRLDNIQLHGDESPEFCKSLGRRVMKSFRIKNLSSLEPMKNYNVSALVLDAYSPHAYGGTGLTFNWDIAAVAKQYGRIILAGGLTAENVRTAVDAVSPYAVDVSSGVESSPGKKDAAKVRAFVRNAKKYK